MSAVATEARLEARVRADVYAFLSSVIPYPTAKPNLGILEHVAFEDGPLEAARQAVVAAETDVESMRAQHRILFPAVESQDAPSYETAYSKHDVFRQGQVMADVAGFYRAHGLKSGGKRKDRPDGIGSQLEFLGFLAAKQDQALADDNQDAADLCVETQQLFLADHVGGWAPEYGRRVAAVSDDPFYDAVGRFLTAWLDSDMERLGIVPIEIDGTPGGDAVPVPDPHVGWDDLSCGGVV